MRFTVFGATGGTGVHFVRQALDADHDVDAVVRRPDAVSDRHPGLVVYEGDVMRPDTLKEPINGTDAVVFLVGPHSTGPCTVYSSGGHNVIEAMRAAGARRILAVTAALVDQPNDTLVQRATRRIVRRVFREVQADRLVFEQELRESGLDWTNVRPPRLVEGAGKGVYRTAFDTGVRGGLTLTRSDLAKALLTMAADAATHGHTVDIAY
ncbi:hypothetical protein GCM10010404_06230 [Nonomuraea africana]|uniref:NADH-flavin reductase n=1 Tax=Nonomuraea africana TaxID=46171 RepID=A0ABR9KM47_9ACTN|nr:NAD(P)H-binding protein [Nonomuraea africana]MBE1562632.1 putative NADH-flavin reductase [Nonomuraea africana]